jgi:hypothetical protein
MRPDQQTALYRAAIKVRTGDNQGEKGLCRLRRREGGARPEVRAAENWPEVPPGRTDRLVTVTDLAVDRSLVKGSAHCPAAMSPITS